MAVISLTQDRFAIVDEDDALLLDQWRWYYSKGGYAVRNARRETKQRRKIWMHRQIMNAPEDMEVDHINGNTLDNRRINLRLCNHVENVRNQHIARGATSRYKGVSWDSRSGKWQAQIGFNTRVIYLGRFADEADAAAAYDRAARERFGEFAHLNFGEQQ